MKNKDIKSVSLASRTRRGFSLTCVMHNKDIYSFYLGNAECARIKNSPVQHQNIKKDTSMWQMAENKLNNLKNS